MNRGHIHPPSHFCGSNCPMNPNYRRPNEELIERIKRLEQQVEYLMDKDRETLT